MIVYFIAPVLVLIYGDCERCLERVRGVGVAGKSVLFPYSTPPRPMPLRSRGFPGRGDRVRPIYQGVFIRDWMGGGEWGLGLGRDENIGYIPNLPARITNN